MRTRLLTRSRSSPTCIPAPALEGPGPLERGRLFAPGEAVDCGRFLLMLSVDMVSREISAAFKASGSTNGIYAISLWMMMK